MCVFSLRSDALCASALLAASLKLNDSFGGEAVWDGFRFALVRSKINWTICLKIVPIRLKNWRIYPFISYEVNDNKIGAESIDSAPISGKVMYCRFKRLN